MWSVRTDTFLTELYHHKSTSKNILRYFLGRAPQLGIFALHYERYPERYFLQTTILRNY